MHELGLKEVERIAGKMRQVRFTFQSITGARTGDQLGGADSWQDAPGEFCLPGANLGGKFGPRSFIYF